MSGFVWTGDEIERYKKQVTGYKQGYKGRLKYSQVTMVQ